ERWLTTVRAVDPDVIATLESNQWWQDTVFADLRAAYPHAVEVPQEDTYGMHLYSRLPLEDVAVRRRVDDIVPSIEATVVLPSGSRVTAYVLHPMPPRPEFNQHTDRRDAELILVAREVAARREADPARPIIVAGDLNDVAWSRTTLLFQRLSGLLDPRKGRGPYSTFHADYWPLRWPLDHVFHSDDLRLLHLERLGHVGSDHFPIHVAFVLDPAAAPYQNAPEAEADDREDAAAVLDEAAKRAAERDPEEEPAPEER
ncbi:MAG: endonuclease/exonuclease/phosphatase family protein, partial [Bacteroidota bacterium]